MRNFTLDETRGYAKDVFRKQSAEDPSLVSFVDQLGVTLRERLGNNDLDANSEAEVRAFLNGAVATVEILTAAMPRLCESHQHNNLHNIQALQILFAAVETLGTLPPVEALDRTQVLKEITDELRQRAEAQPADPEEQFGPLSDEEFQAGLRSIFGTPKEDDDR